MREPWGNCTYSIVQWSGFSRIPDGSGQCVSAAGHPVLVSRPKNSCAMSTKSGSCTREPTITWDPDSCFSAFTRCLRDCGNDPARKPLFCSFIVGDFDCGESALWAIFRKNEAFRELKSGRAQEPEKTCPATKMKGIRLFRNQFCCIWFGYISGAINPESANRARGEIIFKCLAVLYVDPQNLMTNRRNRSPWSRCRFRGKNKEGNKV
jgi:hypothetical protein